MSIYVGTGRINYPAMRGPCLYGYHVPSNNERKVLYDILITTFGLASNGITLKTYLLVPYNGRRTPSISDQGSNLFLWTSTGTSATSAYDIVAGDSAIYQAKTRTNGKHYGIGIRPFKDDPVVPTSSWTKLYDGSSVATGAGIFHNAISGLISISGDGTNWITIADKNLGATTVYNNGNTLSEANCGKYYQRGNNYGFAWTGSITTRTTQVDASAYGPGNWYYSDSFVNVSLSDPHDRSSVTNNNLRGGVVGAVKSDVKDICVGKGLDDYSTRQGPCPAGFHVPSQTEWNNLNSKGQNIGAWTSGQGTVMAEYIKCPLAGYLQFNSASKYQSGSAGRYNTQSIGVSFRMNSTAAQVASHNGADGTTMRPFKDTPVEADSTWTVLFSGANGKGIWRHKGLGLISLYDGSSWTTIADKNLGATKAWSSGDSLDENNCGYYYQGGNNYGFPYSGPSSTATSQVDVSNYGPSYPYYSNTFIKRSSSPYPRGTSSLVIDRVGGQLSSYYNLWGSLLTSLYKGNVKQVYVGTTPVRPTYNPGIYWNKAKGLISVSSDGKNWITITDKNAGAKIVYNYGDTLNTDNAGSLYQWGNNYGFPYTGTITTSTTRISTSGYSWSNPYWGTTFVKTSGAPSDWSSTQNPNLWGNTTNTLDARRGPCPYGFHVPTQTDLYNGLRSIMMTGLGLSKLSEWSNYLKIPVCGRRNNQGNNDVIGSQFYWITSTFVTGTYSEIRAIYGQTSNDSISTGTFSSYASFGGSIRPFKNEPVVPDNSRAVLYQPS